MPELTSGRRARVHTRARALACWWLTEDLGLTATAAAAHVGVSQPAVSRLVAGLRERGPSPPPLVESSKT